ncbi:aldehyde dehydrogenase family protein [bacterium 210820-DFI.6.37]|nr:aldehyde dehydrogenase family protein [bacterium 210820-DFI.6.37]
MDYKLYINGKWQDSGGGQRLKVENPATRTFIGSARRGTREDVDLAVAAAKAAFPAWSSCPVEERAAVLRKIGRLMENRRAEFATTISQELGMPQKHVQHWQIDSPVREAAYFADLAEAFSYEIPQKGGFVRREPMGVVAALTPWNYPLEQITLKVFPALAAGNCVVLKPSQQAPLCACMLTEILDEAGLPAGVFNLVTGAGGEVGNLLALHPDVDMVTFTGSTEAGKEVGRMALSTVKKLALELGGKSPLILLEGGDLKAAARDAAASAFMNSGQTCCAFTRVLVPKDRKREMEEALIAEAKKYRVGDPADEASDLGPVISERAFLRIKGYIEKGLEEGAKLIAGAVPDCYEKGYYIEPVVFSDVTGDMTLAREEIFGPVLSILTYETEEEAVAAANDTPYGLDSAVYGPESRALEVAKKIKAGGVHINGAPFHFSFPFGGYKESGLGREGGTFGFEEYLQIKAVLV